jgi:hypothetical protein
MASTKITRESLYALKVKFDTEQEQKRLEEERIRKEKAAETARIATQKMQEEERKRLEAIKAMEQELVRDILQRMVDAATAGQDTLVVDVSKQRDNLSLFEVIDGIRREIPDICLNVHEYDEPEHQIQFVRKIKSINICWRPGSGRGYLG